MDLGEIHWKYKHWRSSNINFFLISPRVQYVLNEVTFGELLGLKQISKRDTEIIEVLQNKW